MNAAQQIVAGEPRLRILHGVFILSGCRDARGHLNSIVRLLSGPSHEHVMTLTQISAFKTTRVLLQKAVLVVCAGLIFASFLSAILFDSYYVTDLPREPKQAEGRIYPYSPKPVYPATVYLTRNEKLFSDWPVPVGVVLVFLALGLNARWKAVAPYGKETE
jgi:hypothetical protein